MLTSQKNARRQRLEVMASRIESLVVTSTDPKFPKRLQPTPLFRYDDETRGYVDGTIWRLGEKGRPLAIITAELHPRYLGSGSRIVYDFLSLTDRSFTARSLDVAGWSPGESAVALQPLADAPPPAADAARRLAQLKQQARRFSGTQVVQETGQDLCSIAALAAADRPVFSRGARAGRRRDFPARQRPQPGPAADRGNRWRSLAIRHRPAVLAQHAGGAAGRCFGLVAAPFHVV